MTEKKFQNDFGKWAKHNLTESCALEYKVAKGDRIPFSAFKPHQIPSLLSAKKRKIYYKIADVGYDSKPFDAFMLVKSKAYIVIMFYKKRGDKEFFIIDAEDFDDYMVNNPTKKSITKEETKSIASIVGYLS